MKRRILIFLQIALLLMMYVPAAVADSSIVMSLSKTTASGGDTVTASGTTFPESWVPIKVVDEIGNIVLFDTGKADASGNYSIDFVIPSLNPCTLTVVVGEGSNVVSKNLSIVAAISLSLSKTMASPGDTVTASGKTSPESWVPIKAVDEIGNIVLFDTGKADASGNYSIDFVIPSLSPCTLTVVVGEGSNVVSKNLTIVAAISLSLSKTMVLPSDTVTASGKTSPESWVPIKAVDEIGNIVLFDTGKADAEGNYSIDFVVPENASGVLTIVVGEGSNVASQTLTIVTELIPVTGVSIVQNDQTLEKGQTVQLTAAVEPANATNKAVTWTSSDDSIATVSTDGLVTAVGKGTAIITVTTVDGGLTDTIKVTVLPDLLEVSTYEFEYTVPEEVISGVDYKVPVTIKPVTVGDIGYESVRFNVNVTAPEGETLQLLATDTNGIEHDVAAIGYWGPQNGFPIAKDYSATTEFTAIFSGAGKYIISFSLVEMKTGVTLITENVTIDVDPKISMSLSKTTASVGDTVIVSGKTSPGSWVPIKAMDEIGNILLFDTGKADAEGNYSIDFVVPENASGVLTIVVGKGSNVASQTLTIVTELIPVTGVSIVQNDQTLEKGQTVQLTAAVEPANATNKAVTWTSSDDSIATVSTDGLVTAVGKGTAIITVTTQDGNFTASINVKVTATVAQPKASPTGGSVGAGTKVTLKAATSGADIYYTLDESTPTTGSNKYTEPIVINEPVTIKAIAVKAGMDDSTVMIESYSLAKAIEDTEVEVSESDKDLAITQETLDLGDTIKINVPENVKDATVSVSALMSPPDESGTVTTGALPALNIDATDAAIGKIQVSIPEGATISAPAEWNGTINVPSVKPVDSVKVDPDPGKKVTVNAVIEVGFGDIPLTFSKAVRLVIPGQAGKDAGYYRDGKFYKIPSLPSGAQDEQDWADANIDDGKDGKMDVAQDVVIWTKHFTKFVSYTQTDTGGSTAPGGDGGGSPLAPKPVVSKTGSAQVKPGAGGTISLGDEAAIDIPANALTGTSAVEVKVAKVTAPPSVPSGFKLAGNVYEFTIGGKSSYSFAKKVAITISFDPGKLSPGEIPVVYYYDADGKKWVKVGGELKGNTLTVQVDHFTMFAVLAEVKPEDHTLRDIAGHWAEDNIKQLIGEGAIGGYPDGTFKPENRITRAEFATILVKAFKLEPQRSKIFADTAGHWAQDSIATAAHYGIVNGYDAETFGPNDSITREQAAVMVIKAAQLTPATGGLSFGDSDSVSGWAKQAVATAVDRVIINGYPDNTFRPQGNATRAEAVTIVVNALKERATKV